VAAADLGIGSGTHNETDPQPGKCASHGPRIFSLSWFFLRAGFLVGRDRRALLPERRPARRPAWSGQPFEIVVLTQGQRGGAVLAFEMPCAGRGRDPGAAGSRVCHETGRVDFDKVGVTGYSRSE